MGSGRSGCGGRNCWGDGCGSTSRTARSPLIIVCGRCVGLRVVKAKKTNWKGIRTTEHYIGRWATNSPCVLEKCSEGP